MCQDNLPNIVMRQLSVNHYIICNFQFYKLGWFHLQSQSFCTYLSKSPWKGAAWVPLVHEILWLLG